MSRFASQFSPVHFPGEAAFHRNQFGRGECAREGQNHRFSASCRVVLPLGMAGLAPAVASLGAVIAFPSARAGMLHSPRWNSPLTALMGSFSDFGPRFLGLFRTESLAVGEPDKIFV